MTARKAFTICLLGCAFTLVSVADTHPQQTDAGSTAVVRLRLQVADALSNTVPENRFVEGEQLLVKAVLSAPEALDAIAEYDRAALRVTTLQKSGDQMELSEARAAESTARQKRDRLLSELTDQGVLQEARETLTLEIYSMAGQGTVPTKTAIVPRLLADRVDEVAPHPTVTKQIWELPRDQMGPGHWQIRGTVGEHAAPYTVAFEIVTVNDASPAERSRALYVRARVARDQEDAANALALAQLAVSEGAPQSYDVMSAYALMGDLYAAQGDLEPAVDAYEEAMAIAAAAFPTSRLPELLGRKVQELRAKLQKLEER